VIVWNSLQEDTVEISDKTNSFAIPGGWKVQGISYTVFEVSSFEIRHFRHSWIALC